MLKVYLGLRLRTPEEPLLPPSLALFLLGVLAILIGWVCFSELGFEMCLFGCFFVRYVMTASRSMGMMELRVEGVWSRGGALPLCSCAAQWMWVERAAAKSNGERATASLGFDFAEPTIFCVKKDLSTRRRSLELSACTPYQISPDFLSDCWSVSPGRVESCHITTTAKVQQPQRVPRHLAPRLLPPQKTFKKL